VALARYSISSVLVSFKSSGGQTGQSGDGGSGTLGLLVILLVTLQTWQEFLAKTALNAGRRYPEVKARRCPVITIANRFISPITL
jgi:hypothetical protein